MTFHVFFFIAIIFMAVIYERQQKLTYRHTVYTVISTVMSINMSQLV